MNDEQRPLPNGWRLSAPYPESKEADYVKRVVEELKAIPRIKMPVSLEQTPVTQALLDAQKLRPEHQDAEYIRNKMDAPISEAAQIRDASGGINVGTRQLGVEEMLIAEDIRHKGRNTLGQSEASSVDTDKRQAGIEAFTYSKPADLTQEQIKRLTKLTEIVNTPLEPVEPKKPTLLQRMFAWAQREQKEWDLHDSSTWRNDDAD